MAGDLATITRDSAVGSRIIQRDFLVPSGQTWEEKPQLR
jgi:hypothetical protein